MHRMWILAAAVAAVLLAGCERSTPAAPVGDSSRPVEDATPLTIHSAPERPAGSPSAPDAKDVAPAVTAANGFSVASVAVAEQPLGDFPYLKLPSLVVPREQSTLDFDHFPFWTGDRMQWVEGRIHQASFAGADGRPYSPAAVNRAVASMVARAGGVEVARGRVPSAMLVEYKTDRVNVRYNGGIGDAYNNPAGTYLIRRPDRDIWIHLSTGENWGGWVIAEAMHDPDGDTPGSVRKAQDATFDMADAPLSEVPLGEFPYLALPSQLQLRGESTTYAFDHFPFWTGDRMRWVEGRFHQARFAGKDGGQYSPFAVRRTVESMVTAAGGVEIAHGKIPPAMLEEFRSDGVATRYVDGMGDPYNRDTTTYVIRRVDRDIWIHLNTGNLSGGWIIAETEPFQATAKLLPASQLKQQLDTEGKVALQVNFATDKAEILSESMPQIVQVVELLKLDPALELAINGHTDSTGDPTHNQQLSEDRANSVVRALVARGIDAARLQAHGFGQDRPVADNDTAAGRASNRRVELVRRSGA